MLSIDIKLYTCRLFLLILSMIVSVYTVLGSWSVGWVLILVGRSGGTTPCLAAPGGHRKMGTTPSMRLLPKTAHRLFLYSGSIIYI